MAKSRGCPKGFQRATHNPLTGRKLSRALCIGGVISGSSPRALWTAHCRKVKGRRKCTYGRLSAGAGLAGRRKR